MKILEHYTYTGYKTSVYKQPSPLTRQYTITTSTKPEYSTILNTSCVLHFALFLMMMILMVVMHIMKVFMTTHDYRYVRVV